MESPFIHRLVLFWGTLLLCFSLLLRDGRIPPPPAPLPLPLPALPDVVKGEACMKLYVDPSDKPLSNILPADFASISLEWGQSEVLARSKTFRTLLNYLRNNSTGQGINVRVGGNSADSTWWNDVGDSKNETKSCGASYSGKVCNRFNMTTSTLMALYSMAQDTNSSLILDLTMAQNHSTEWAMEEMQHMFQVLEHGRFPPNILEGLEIGNEPDMFDRTGRRNPRYNVTHYQEELAMYMADVVNATEMWGRNKLIRGGGFAYKKEFNDIQKKMMTEYSKSFYSWSYHRYPTLACPGQEPTMRDLLSDAATLGQAKSIAPYASFAVANNLSYHLGETNSADCGGMLGLSDTMASALWALDYMFVMASNNVTRLNFHGGGRSAYSWFWINETTQIPSVKPLYYAMFVWTWIMRGIGSQVIPLHCQGWGCPDNFDDPANTSVCPECAIACIANNTHRLDTITRIKAHAVKDESDHYTIILINKSLEPSAWNGGVQIYFRFLDQKNINRVVAQQATLEPNSGGGLSATELRFQGWTWTDSKAGEGKGQFKPDEAFPQKDSDGNYFFFVQVPRGEIVILTLSLKPVAALPS